MYSSRGKHNPFDAYMAGICLWMTPRQILIIEKMCNLFEGNLSEIIDREAFADFKEQIDFEAGIKRKKYLGEDSEKSINFPVTY